MSTPAEVVANSFSQAQTYADLAQGHLVTFTDALSGAIYTAPTAAFEWAAVAEPSVVSMPSAPTITADFTWSVGDIPTALTDVPVEVVIDDFTAVEPTLDAAPTLDFGIKPTVDAIAVIATPDEPVIDAVAAPAYLSLTTPTFAGLDLHSSFLTNLDTVPTLEIVAPTPYTYSPGAEYASTLLTTVKAKITARLAGGTGLDPTDEAAIWDRARSREAKTATANTADVNRQSEALGYQFPPGVIAASLRQVQQDYFDKVSGLSRDIGIKQADLAQENMKQAIAAGMDLEGKLIDYSYRLEELAYQTAKTVAENAIQIRNSQIEEFRSLISAYQSYATAYGALIDGEKLKLEQYRGELQGEETKANINRTLVEQLKAQIQAGESLVRIYEAKMGGAKTRMELEQAKLAATAEEIRAYVAGINGETAKVEAWKAVQSGKVQLYGALASAFSAKAGAQGEKARANLSYFQALIGAKSSEWEGYRSRVAGETARFQGIAAQSGAVLDSFKVGLAAAQATVDQDIKHWEIGIKQYEAQYTYSLAVSKLQTEVIQANRQATLDAAKAGAQVYAQLTASAYSMIHASAGVSASASNSVGYSYSNDTSSTVGSVTAV